MGLRAPAERMGREPAAYVVFHFAGYRSSQCCRMGCHLDWGATPANVQGDARLCAVALLVYIELLICVLVDGEVLHTYTRQAATKKAAKEAAAEAMALSGHCVSRCML